MDKDRALMKQYSKMMDLGRHYDQKLWLIPGAAYAVSGVILKEILSLDAGQVALKVLLASVSTMIFFGFLMQLIKDRAFQLGNQDALNNVKTKLGMEEANEFSGVQPDNPKDRWFIQLTRKWSAANTVIRIMIILLLAQLCLVGYFLCRICCKCG